MERLAQLIAELESRIPDSAVVSPAVSKGSVGWHVAHSLLVLNRVLTGLQQSDPAQYKPAFSLNRVLLMTFGKIPRGKITAPEAVRPEAGFDAQSLQRHIDATRANLKAATALSPGHYFTHPFLGDFKVRPALKFLAIHTGHHLHIINDILRSSKSAS